MKKPNLKSLKAMDFTKMTPARDAKIQAAPATSVPSADSYVPNQIANALHPHVQHLKVDKIVEWKDDAKSFYLVADKEKGTESLAWFNAGQYIALCCMVGEKLLTRPYSLASSPREALDEGYYMITVKKVDGGLASQYILDNWEVGTEVIASAPLGNFTYEPLRDAKTVIGVAGGSGITPFRSLALSIASGDEDANLVLLYGTKTLENAIFEEELKALEMICPKFKMVNVLSEESIEGCEEGFITAELIKKYAPEGEEYSIFLCGPQAMYDFVDKEIEKLNLRRKFVRHEVFGEYFNPSKEMDYPENVEDSYQVTVKMADKTYIITASSDESLLRSMEANGILAPSDCRSGQCGWCHSRLVSGEVYVPKSVDGRREADHIYGYIHPCCSFPLSDVVIDVPPLGV